MEDIALDRSTPPPTGRARLEEDEELYQLMLMAERRLAARLLGIIYQVPRGGPDDELSAEA